MSAPASTAAHTPGPWAYRAADRIEGSPQTFEALVYGADNNHYVADVFGVSRIGTVIPWEANARLIAAAPTMLAALKNRVCGSCDGSGTAYTHEDETQVGCPPGSSGIPCPECSESRAAIAKATGV